jgi:hypothetical protein
MKLVAMSVSRKGMVTRDFVEVDGSSRKSKS